MLVNSITHCSSFEFVIFHETKFGIVDRYSNIIKKWTFRKKSIKLNSWKVDLLVVDLHKNKYNGLRDKVLLPKQKNCNDSAFLQRAFQDFS